MKGELPLSPFISTAIAIVAAAFITLLGQEAGAGQSLNVHVLNTPLPVVQQGQVDVKVTNPVTVKADPLEPFCFRISGPLAFHVPVGKRAAIEMVTAISHTLFNFITVKSTFDGIDIDSSFPGQAGGSYVVSAMTKIYADSDTDVLILPDAGSVSGSICGYYLPSP